MYKNVHVKHIISIISITANTGCNNELSSLHSTFTLMFAC